MTTKSENNLHRNGRTNPPHDAASRHDAGRGHEVPRVRPSKQLTDLWSRMPLDERLAFLNWIQNRPNQYGDAERHGGRKATIGELRDQIRQREHKARTP